MDIGDRVRYDGTDPHVLVSAGSEGEVLGFWLNEDFAEVRFDTGVHVPAIGTDKEALSEGDPLWQAVDVRTLEVL